MSAFRSSNPRGVTPELPPVLLDNAKRADMTVSCPGLRTDPEGARGREGHSVRRQAGPNHAQRLAGCRRWLLRRLDDRHHRAAAGHHEPQEEAIFYEILEHPAPDATMLDLGGFWSYYSLWFKSEHGDQRQAYVVEPDPAHIAVGRANAALNHSEITFVQGCVGAEPIHTVTFPTESAWNIRIPQISIPSFLREHRISKLDILHCDTQGAETEIIRSCETLFRDRAMGFGIFSTHSHHISGDPLTHQRCLAMLKDFGGTILAEHDVHESFSGDGLIAAYFGQEPLQWKEPPISRNRYSTSLFRNPLYDLAAKA